MKYTKKDNKKHKPKTHKKRSNRKSKKHVKKRGGNTTLKHRGGSFLKKIVNKFTDPHKSTIGVGLDELNNIILSPRKETSEMLSTWTKKFVNQGRSLSSSRNDYVGIDSDDNVYKLYKLAKAIYYSVYAHLLEKVDMIPFPESLPREELGEFITKMKTKRDEHFKDFKNR